MGRWETMENALKAVDDVAEAWRRDRRELRDEINWLHAELHGAELEAKKLRELLVGAFEDMDAWQMVIACSDQWGYGKGCLERLCELRDAMRELGMEVSLHGC